MRHELAPRSHAVGEGEVLHRVDGVRSVAASVLIDQRVRVTRPVVGDDVVAEVAAQQRCVIARTAFDRVVTVAAEERVVLPVASQRIGALAPLIERH
jgi:hypothetical protein